jgi:hypothetical protein
MGIDWDGISDRSVDAFKRLRRLHRREVRITGRAPKLVREEDGRIWRLHDTVGYPTLDCFHGSFIAPLFRAGLLEVTDSEGALAVSRLGASAVVPRATEAEPAQSMRM